MRITRAVGVLVLGLVLAAASAPARAQLLYVEIIGTPTERAAPISRLDPDTPLTLREIVESILLVADSPQLAGALIGLNDARLTPTQAEEIGRAILIARAAGKGVHVFAAAYDQPGLMLAAGSDDVLLQTGGQVMLPGLHAEELYLADTLDWIGVRAQLVQVGEFKGANEMMTRTEPSEAWDENIASLLDGLYAEVRRPFERERGMSEEDTDRAFQNGWGLPGDEAVELGIVDRLLDYAAIPEFIASRYGAGMGMMPAEVMIRAGLTPAEWAEGGGRHAGDGSEPEPAGAPEDLPEPGPLGALLDRLGVLIEPERAVDPDLPVIAVVHIDGPIVDGLSDPSGRPGSAVGSSTIRQVLAELEDDAQVAGVIVRIDSPGGSALASEVMWQGIRRLVDRDKPVWTSVGGTAASGGYYVAVGTERIYANPSSVVGSIGVVGGKVTVGGLLERGRIHLTERSRGPLGPMASSVRPWTDDELLVVEDRIRAVYDLFTDRVTAGRPRADFERIGAGRLFTGRQARPLGMVDSLGGLEDAVEDMSIGLGLTEYRLVHYPRTESVLDAVLGMVAGGPLPAMEAPGSWGASSGSSLGAVLDRLVRPVVVASMGEGAWRQLRAAVLAVAELRDGGAVLASPRLLIVR